MNTKALVAMSGGVDSSVTAALMKKAGYDCVGATMRLYVNNDTGASCSGSDDAEDARQAAARLGMPHVLLDASEQFEEDVIRRFIRVYEEGGTPNPCIYCNRALKFSYLWQQAQTMGCDTIATGHYARIVQSEDGRYLLKKGLDEGKDQSYVLYMLGQDVLAHTIFPLGGMSKPQVRALAEDMGLLNARKHDSQDICFVPDGDYGRFIRQYTGRDYPYGNFLDLNGKILGCHHGMIDYTIGQRRGLGVAVGHPIYVCRKCPEDNTVILSDNDALFSRVLYANEINLIDRDCISAPLHCAAKIRYRHTEQPCIVTQLDDNSVRVEFDVPQRAIAAGQSVVFYDGDIVIGGGTITASAEK